MGTLRRLGYTQTRTLLVIVGLAILGLLALFTYLTKVETVEVVATLLFVPVFLGFVFFKLPGGIFTGILVSIVYGLMRYSRIDAFGGGGNFALYLTQRSVMFIGFGLLGGWASGQLESSLVKLELFDQIDDSTGLFNARFFVQDTELEESRSGRYRTFFSIASVEVPSTVLFPMSRRESKGALKEMGSLLAASVRTVDRASYGRGATSHRFAVVLPETGRAGAQIFVDRLADGLAGYLTKRGAQVEASSIPRAALTYPEDAEHIKILRQQFDQIDKAEHPEAEGEK